MRELTVLHPIDPNVNLMGLCSRRALRHALSMGASKLASVFTAASALGSTSDGSDSGGNGCLKEGISSSTTTEVSSLDGFFANTWARFGSGWRPDVFDLDGDYPGASSNQDGASSDSEGEFRNPPAGHGGGLGGRFSSVSGSAVSALAVNEDPLEVGVTFIRGQVDYCCLLLEVEVTEPALRTLAGEVLADRGPLPVGEIGKMLQEITANASLSTILKEKFGGLKKFLEK